MAMKMFTSRFRWLTTVGLQGFLGLFFIAFPAMTMRALQVPVTVHMGILLQLYGALLLHRTVMEQMVRNRREMWLIRAYMISTFPFGIGSAIILSYASIQGLMSALIGWIWVALFVAEVAEFAFVLAWQQRERPSPP